MPRAANDSKTHIWVDKGMPDVWFMMADFCSHTFSKHIHDEYVIAVTESGSAQYTVNGKLDYVSQGDILLLNPNEPHSGRIPEDCRWSYRAFYVLPNVYRRIVECHCPNNTRDIYFNVPKLKNQKIAQQLLSLHSYCQDKSSIINRKSQFVDCLREIMLCSSSEYCDLEQRYGAIEPVKIVVEFLAKNYSRQIFLEEIADLAGLSVFHLIRLFNQTVGMSPHAFLVQIRLRKARALLKSQMPLAEVANSVGFYDQSAFSNTFKRAYGTTPKQITNAVKSPSR